jgi:GMP synthase-like glutamine amidotransferase
MKIHFFQHVPFEGPGTIRQWAESRGHKVSTTRFFHGELPPDVDKIDWLIIMGGPMSANDENSCPWLRKEKHYISRAVKSELRVLGICLGAQLMASALGAKVFPNAQREIGWFPVKLTERGIGSAIFSGFPEQFTAFHWHGETFDLPEGAEQLAETTACKNQAFSCSRALALQFHFEVEKQGVESLVRNCGDELKDSPYIQKADSILDAGAPYEEIKSRMFQLLDRMEK